MSPATHWFWIASRGAGTTALILSATTISYGLLMGGRMARGARADHPLGTRSRRAYHEALALSTLVALAIHALTLLGDPFLHPTVADVTVPFASSYMRLGTSLGIFAGWAILAFGLSMRLRDRIGRARVAVIHRLTVLAWVLGLVHTFLEGTDAGQAWFIALVTISSAPVVALLAARLAGPLARRERGRGHERRGHERAAARMDAMSPTALHGAPDRAVADPDPPQPRMRDHQPLRGGDARDLPVGATPSGHPSGNNVTPSGHPPGNNVTRSVLGRVHVT